jgi:hypothetical protein
MDKLSALSFRPLWNPELRNEPLVESWLWTGYLAPGAVTLLASPAKCGKTTLLAALLARLASGGMLAGQQVAAGKVLVVSEESEQRWHARGGRFDFGQHVCFVCRPFRSKPTPQQWQELLQRIGDLHRQHGFALVVFDTLTELLPRKCENDAGLMMEALMPLRALTAAGLAVLLVAHTSKKETVEGLRARGTGALGDHVNIGLELGYCRRPSEDDRRRKLTAQSHFDETPRQRIIELDEAGTDYHSRGDFAEEEFQRHWDELAVVLAGAEQPLTCRQIRADWPEQSPRPPQPSLSRWLARAQRGGLLRCSGHGRRNDPYHYWLPGQEDQWAAAAHVREQEALDGSMDRLLADAWVEQQMRRVAGRAQEASGGAGSGGPPEGNGG